jgi:hypothetical protein
MRRDPLGNPPKIGEPQKVYLKGFLPTGQG